MYDELTGCYWEDVRKVKEQEGRGYYGSAKAVGMSILGFRIFQVFSFVHFRKIREYFKNIKIDCRSSYVV